MNSIPMPKMGNLNSIHCITPTSRGNIEVSIKKQDEKVKMDLSIPENSKAIIGIPKAGIVIKKIYANNILLEMKQMTDFKKYGVKYFGEDKNYILFHVLPGKWEFTTQKQ